MQSATSAGSWLTGEAACFGRARLWVQAADEGHGDDGTSASSGTNTPWSQPRVSSVLASMPWSLQAHRLLSSWQELCRHICLDCIATLEPALTA